MGRKFQRKPGLFYLNIPFIGKVERNQIIEDDRCIPYLGRYFIEVTKPEDLEPVIEPSLEEMAKEHLADILKEEKLEVMVIEPEKEKDISEIPVDLIDTKSEPGLEVKKKGGRPKKVVDEK